MYKFSLFWRSYIFLALSSTAFALTITYFIWQSILADAKSELIYANRIMSSSVHSILIKHESLLKILGERLLENNGLEENNQSSITLVNNLLKNNVELAGFGLAKPSGELVLTSFEIDHENPPNLLTMPETSATFKKALQSEHMVLGKTYFMKNLQQWVIPLRYRILDANGAIAAVMTSGLKVGSSQPLWSDSQLPDYMKLFIVREDFYRQYVPKASANEFKSTYSKAIPDAWVTDFKEGFKREIGLDFSAIRKRQPEVFAFTSQNESNRNPALSAISFDPVFAHYTFTVIARQSLTPRLYQPILWLFISLLLFNAALSWVFRSNTRLQDEARKNLKFQATHDQLTSLPNRRYLLNEFTQWALDCSNQFYVIYIDLDNFKNCNDLYGHSIGDQILQEVALRIKNGFSECLTIRQGGDEFIILCPDKGNQYTLNLCNHFLQQLIKPILISDLDFSIKASIGISHAPEHGSNIDDLLRKADMAMYEAKRSGNTSFIYSDHLEKRQKYNVIIEKELSLALEKNELFLVYQPQVDATTQKTMGVEVLLRWENKNQGLVPPDIFIPIAESTGLINNIGDFVLETSMYEISMLIKANPQFQEIRLSVNISINQLLNIDFINKISWLHKKYPDICLVIEVTENLFIEDLNTAKLILEKVQAIGIDISLDDFGTGYSSLSVLNKLPINELKIDKSFVQHALSNESDKNLIQSIISLGKSLNIPVLSEGVESKEQADLLLEFGCDLFQGYYFSKPLKIEKLEKFLN